MAQPTETFTQLLTAVGQGDASAQVELSALVYDELHRLAQRQRENEPPSPTLGTTSLIHEAYLRLTAGETVPWENRRYFFAAVAKAMRRIRIDDARKGTSLKRAGDLQRQPLQDDAEVSAGNPAEALAADEALKKLELEHPLKAEVVTLRYFAGLTVDETATALGLSPKTVDNDWRFARAWLHRELSGGDTDTGRGG